MAEIIRSLNARRKLQEELGNVVGEVLLVEESLRQSLRQAIAPPLIPARVPPRSRQKPVIEYTSGSFGCAAGQDEAVEARARALQDLDQ
ncbi:hypothetical protein AXG93_4182s1150 [Marchantia polymorpha subsp. ruderalis]|uniref:Uncharacterized protein n=1 Tax=Marchantia polymorpha subsp. ruderalis TaxID=1480154 RepID=A0A176VE09_MARPO|nr:hypothetical protein AXG93_4182s1150 [Marchantia polymorpha subsp. ruderalis]